MQTSVFKEIMDRSITGDKISGGEIDWLDKLTVNELIVKGLTDYEGKGSIDGTGFNIGSSVPINQVTADIIIARQMYTNNLEIYEDMDFPGSDGLLDFYSRFSDVETIVNGMVDDTIDEIPSHVVTQLKMMVSPSTVTLSNTQWIRMSTMQSVASGDNVTFGSIVYNTLAGNAIYGTTLALSGSTLNAFTATIRGQEFYIGGTSFGIGSAGAAKLLSLNVNDVASVSSGGNAIFKDMSLSGRVLRTRGTDIILPSGSDAAYFLTLPNNGNYFRVIKNTSGTVNVRLINSTGWNFGDEVTIRFISDDGTVTLDYNYSPSGVYKTCLFGDGAFKTGHFMVTLVYDDETGLPSKPQAWMEKSCIDFI
jgi:hypothetical protein